MFKLFLSAVVLPIQTVEALVRIASAIERLADAFEETSLDQVPESFLAGFASDQMEPIRWPGDMFPQGVNGAPHEPNLAEADFSQVRDYVHDEDLEA